jgi:alpha-1,2-mannosyltransferase
VDAFSLLVPDIFIDTMGYAFALAFGKFCYPQMPTAAYVHYPTISTDMLGALDLEPGKGLHAGAGKGLRGVAKKKYWRLFALIYSWVGGHVDVVMANSSWTRAHMQALWGPYRTKRQKQSEIEILFPPVAVEELEEAIDVSEASEQKREKILLYIAQFRPEKNHGLILRAFADLIHSNRPDAGARKGLKLKLIGSVRDSKDATRVYELRLLAHELKIKEDVEFIRDASWPEILKWLGKSSIGVNGMWNEHFGIGVVEYQAAGLISVVNNSGGPKDDIVVEMGGGPTGISDSFDSRNDLTLFQGYHASTESEYSAAFLQAISLSPQETLAMRKRARLSARRFTEEAFANHWILQVDKLVALQTKAQVAPK